MNHSENMRAIRSKGMRPELAVRSLVHKLGYRFRLHRRELRLYASKISARSSFWKLSWDQPRFFIGPNNAGKTAILDAIRIALTRRWGQRGAGFTEYDVHLTKEGDDPSV